MFPHVSVLFHVSILFGCWFTSCFTVLDSDVYGVNANHLISTTKPRLHSRHMFLPRAARAERELETTLDAAVLQGIETKTLA